MFRGLRFFAPLAALVLLTFPAAAHPDLPVAPAPPLAVPVAALEGDGVSAYSDNMKLLATWNHEGTYRQGSDLAFWGDVAVLGNYDNPGGFRLLDVADPGDPRLVGQFVCAGSQADVSVFRDLVFMSVDSPRKGAQCGEGGASQGDLASGNFWEGVRVVSIADPEQPVQVAAVDTDCGSHTHTLVPDLKRKRVLIYALSYPLSGQSGECNAATHRKISVIEVPLSDPASALVVATPDVSPAVGCHDVTVYPARRLAGAACITESQLWDISDPAHPTVTAHIVNPAINIHHSTTFDWEAETLVIGDELGGAAATPGCFTGGHAPVGALWFYDVSDLSSPTPVGSFQIPQQELSAFCTAHNFNTVPLKSGRDVLVSAWYNGGTTLVDFTDPANPEQLGYAIPDDENGRAAAWSSYWYRDHVFANNFDEDVNSVTAHSRGFDVLVVEESAFLRDALSVSHLNAQTMERPRSVRL